MKNNTKELRRVREVVWSEMNPYFIVENLHEVGVSHISSVTVLPLDDEN